MTDPTTPPDKAKDTPKPDKSSAGQKFTKRLKQIVRDVKPDALCAVMKNGNSFTFAGNVDLLMRYAMDLLVRRAGQMQIDPLQIVYDLLIQYGYADKGGGLILPGDIRNAVKKPHSSGDGTSALILPPHLKRVH